MQPNSPGARASRPLQKIALALATLCLTSLPCIAQKHNAHKTQSDLDSANNADTVKSWTSETPPTPFDLEFLNSLKWEEQKLGDYVLRLGKIQNKWYAAMQFSKDGKPVLTEYTPPAEYIEVVDPQKGTSCKTALTRDLNKDGVQEIAFVHLKLNDPNYHMYTVYELQKAAPKLIWKSGGKFGDWQHAAYLNMRGGALWHGRAGREKD